MISREFVIAKYHRSTDWTKSLNGKVTIYNKSKDTLLPRVDHIGGVTARNCTDVFGYGGLKKLKEKWKYLNL